MGSARAYQRDGFKEAAERSASASVCPDAKSRLVGLDPVCRSHLPKRFHSGSERVLSVSCEQRRIFAQISFFSFFFSYRSIRQRGEKELSSVGEETRLVLRFTRLKIGSLS